MPPPDPPAEPDAPRARRPPPTHPGDQQIGPLFIWAFWTVVFFTLFAAFLFYGNAFTCVIRGGEIYQQSHMNYKVSEGLILAAKSTRAKNKLICGTYGELFAWDQKKQVCVYTKHGETTTFGLYLIVQMGLLLLGISELTKLAEMQNVTRGQWRRRMLHWMVPTAAFLIVESTVLWWKNEIKARFGLHPMVQQVCDLTMFVIWVCAGLLIRRVDYEIKRDVNRARREAQNEMFLVEQRRILEWRRVALPRNGNAARLAARDSQDTD